MTPDEIKRAFAKVEMRLTDIESARARERQEQRRDFDSMMTSAKKMVEDTVSRARPPARRLLVLMNESKEERIRRAEREKLAAEAKERAAADAKKRAEDEAAAQAARRERFDRYLKILAAVTALIVATGGAIGACSATHASKSGDTHEHAP